MGTVSVARYGYNECHFIRRKCSFVSLSLCPKVDITRTRGRKAAVRKAGKVVRCATSQLERPSTRLSAPTLTRRSAAPAMRKCAAMKLRPAMWRSATQTLLLSLWRAAQWRWRHIVMEEPKTIVIKQKVPRYVSNTKCPKTLRPAPRFQSNQSTRFASKNQEEFVMRFLLILVIRWLLRFLREWLGEFATD